MADTPAADLGELLGRLAGAPVVCVGDLMLDRFVYGSVGRISPEAPIPVLAIERRTSMLGGAGNVARNLAALGAVPHFLAAVGDDTAGDEVARLLAELGASVHLARQPGRPTTIKTRYFAANQQLLRADEETAEPLAQPVLDQIAEHAEAALQGAGALVLSDYGKGLLTADLTGRLIDAARALGVPVVVDPKGRDFSRYRGARVITPNRAEAALASDLPTETDAQVAAAGQALCAASGAEAILITRSQHGMSLIEGAGTLHLPARAREVFDVSGAGDTVVAALAAALAGGLALPEAARLANVAAGIVVGKVGTATASADEVLAALHHQDLWRAEHKLLSLDAAQSRLADWRARGQRIGFTNGCFDLLHPGHLSLLAEARGQCDRLVVGLNSDASVKRLKGPERPIQNEAARATVLAGLAAVDAVVIFAEDTPLSLIKALAPDVLVKGADYTEDQVVGAAEVKARGGRVHLARLKEGHSTTSTVQRLKG
ncbi:D-glycero-beta-D-manno-heptose-7-phosphate kinase [Roseospirillum parvum]|uniref:Bifunctional protein HldE n=1 Tax=Roseospirillum parvum TaxID=83401 RepID=A0A1G7W2F7_9PROT|nr:D-glycero-beta-D-manno-heptose-7-phosphate kinase [Roseospirillum parvum]SDG66051.1 D-beta-D-heptose 7-phosphate kinase / D-beta-D-heptose 1-phosphate adenosyltransferase [Roseospirillum parvum]